MILTSIRFRRVGSGRDESDWVVEVTFIIELLGQPGSLLHRVGLVEELDDIFGDIVREDDVGDELQISCRGAERLQLGEWHCGAEMCPAGGHLAFSLLRQMGAAIALVVVVDMGDFREGAAGEANRPTNPELGHGMSLSCEGASGFRRRFCFGEA